MAGGFRTQSPNDCYEFVLKVTLIIGDEAMLCGKKIHCNLIESPWIKVALRDVESQGDIGQDVGLFIYLIYSKCQSQDMLVILCHETATKVRKCFTGISNKWWKSLLAFLHLQYLNQCIQLCKSLLLQALLFLVWFLCVNNIVFLLINWWVL